MLDPRLQSLLGPTELLPCEPQAVRGGPTPKLLRLWPRPQIWVREHGLWLPCEARLGLVRAVRQWDDRGWRPAVLDLADEVLPDEERGLLKRVHPSFHLSVLRLLDAVPDAASLVRETPLLAAAVAEEVWQEVPMRYEAVQALVRARRTALLEWLGLPPRRWIVRLMRRLDATSIDAGLFDTLLGAIQRGERDVTRALQHIRPMPTWLLEVVVDSLAHLVWTHTLLSEAASLDSDAVRRRLGMGEAANPLRQSLVDLVWMALEEDRKPKPVPSLNALAGRIRVAGLIYGGLWNPEGLPPFAIPPAGASSLPTFPPIALTPLLGAEQLMDHGLEQGNCIPSEDRFIDLATSGDGVFYELRWRTPAGVERAPRSSRCGAAGAGPSTNSRARATGRFPTGSGVP